MRLLFARVSAMLACLIVLVFAASQTRAAGLNVGDPAPPVAVAAFVKGTPVTTFPKGKISVVEFWATWCAPCRESIPHLTALAKKYPQVTILGVSIWEGDPKKVVPFVQKMGDTMNYHVAMDKVAPGQDSKRGAMAKTWMTAAGQDGIPTAFIIGKDGRVAWIGYPWVMDEPLAKIVGGTWDTAGALAASHKKQAAEQVTDTLREDLDKAVQKGDRAQFMAILDKAIAAHPDQEKGTAYPNGLGIAKFYCLIEAGDTGRAVAYGKRLIEAVFPDDWQCVNSVALLAFSPDTLSPAFPTAWLSLFPKPKTDTGKMPPPALAELFLKAARRADTLTQGKNADIASNVAEACSITGDAQGAVAAQERAIALTDPGKADAIASLKEDLAVYQKAAATGK